MLRFILVMESLGKDVMVIDVGKCMGGCIELCDYKSGKCVFWCCNVLYCFDVYIFWYVIFMRKNDVGYGFVYMKKGCLGYYSIFGE